MSFSCKSDRCVSRTNRGFESIRGLKKRNSRLDEMTRIRRYEELGRTNGFFSSRISLRPEVVFIVNAWDTNPNYNCSLGYVFGIHGIIRAVGSL